VDRLLSVIPHQKPGQDLGVIRADAQPTLLQIHDDNIPAPQIPDSISFRFLFLISWIGQPIEVRDKIAMNLFPIHSMG